MESASCLCLHCVWYSGDFSRNLNFSVFFLLNSISNGKLSPVFNDVNDYLNLLFCRFKRKMVRVPIVYSKTYSTPRRPFEKERLDQELKLIGEYGLRNKREVWRVRYTLAKMRKAARELLTLDEKDPRRLFEGMCWMICVSLLVGRPGLPAA